MKESALTEAERSEYLSYIYSSSEKLLQLINYLLDWSKLQSGKLKINARRLRIQELVYNCVSSLTGTAVRKNIEIKVEIGSTVKIFGDERLLNIAITNLISNAIKYSEKDSKVYIKVSRFNDSFAEFIVKDEGIGIPEEIKRKMFRIEKMFSTPGTVGERGTGLGLTLSKEIVERHGGDFWFYSEEGNGSEFHITLPVSSNIILIVEPDSDRRKSLVTSLEKESHNLRIISFANPYEAINNMDKIFPSVVITSHEMPLMNGAQFIETIVERKNRAELKIIILTDSVNEELKNIYGKLGDAVFLSKSVTAKKLSEAVHDLVS
jgi:CheY-like chemotaxis protein/anti-sigma regulatory factor (Ser/Thr protein kinase)